MQWLLCFCLEEEPLTSTHILLAKASHTATCNFMEAMNSCATRGREPEISGGQHYCHPGRHLGLCDVDRLDQSGLRSG